MCFLSVFVIGKSRPKIEHFNNLGNQFENTWVVREGSAREAVCQGGERGRVMLPEFEDFAGEHPV